MKVWDMHSHNSRNKFMMIVCWGLVIFGTVTAWVISDLQTALYVLSSGLALFTVPTVLVWKGLMDKHIKYLVVVVFSLVGYIFDSSIEIYILISLLPVFLTIYFDYRPVILMGIANVIYTIYFVFQNEQFFSSDFPHYNVFTLIFIQLIVTAALTTQSIISQRLRSTTLMMERLSKTDALTGLYNHKSFYEHLEEKLTAYNTGELKHLHLAIIDIDNFKMVNDTYGHSVGDTIIKRVAEIIRNYTNADDFVARYGGEEFAIIFTHKTLSEAFEISERIRIALSRFKHPETNHQPVTISIGIKSAKGLDNKSMLFSQADKLLYKAKSNGKNQTAAVENCMSER